MCFFGVALILRLILGVKCPQNPILEDRTLWSQMHNVQTSILSKPLQRFQPNLHYDRDLQILSVGRPKMHSTNPNGGWLPSWKKINHCISATVWPILTIYTSYDVFLCKDLSFVGHVNIAPYFGVKLTCLMIFKTADISHIGLQKKLNFQW